jgi:hypothetical protein
VEEVAPIRRPNVRLVMSLIIALSAGACVTAEATLVDPSAQLAPTSSVELVLSEPTRPYSVIGMVKARGPTSTSDAKLIEALREKASQIGANGMYVLGREEEAQPEYLVYNPDLYNGVGGLETFDGGTLSVMKAAALRWE